MGSVKVKPTLVHDHTVDQWYKYVPTTSAFSTSHTFLEGLVRMRTRPISPAKSAFK